MKSIGSPLPRILQPIGGCAALLYGGAVRMRNGSFDNGKRESARLPIPVISVGNISAGGTGKTPMVQWVVRVLLEEGCRPIVAMRGYKAASGGKTGGGGKSDEQMEHEERLVDVPVIVGAKRYEMVREFLAMNGEVGEGSCDGDGGGEQEGNRGGYDVCVLDDGFQHRQLARDLDIVLIDATRSPFDDRLLPAGYLREPVESLRRADAVVLMNGDLRDEDRVDLLRVQVGKHHGRAPIARFRHGWRGLRYFAGGGEDGDIHAVGEMARMRLWGVCALANPGRFFDQVEMRGGVLVKQIALRDHYRYTEAGMKRIIGEAERAGVWGIVTTEKDWVKMRSLETVRKSGVLFVRPILEIEAIEGGEEFKRLILSVV